MVDEKEATVDEKVVRWVIRRGLPEERGRV